MIKIDTDKKITVICGHFGVGKTNVAENIALHIKNKQNRTCSLVDMDIVNPYFRSSDNADFLREQGIRVIVPQFAGTNVDVPSVPAEIYSVFTQNDERFIFDIGGDDNGATVLGMYAEKVREAGYFMLYVINKYRPLTAEPSEAALMLKEIEKVSGLKSGGIINNSNLGSVTEFKDIAASMDYAYRVSELAEIPLLCTTLSESIANDNDIDEALGDYFIIKNVTKKIF